MFEGQDLLALGRRAMADLRGKRLALNPVLRIGPQLCETILRHNSVSAAAARARAVEMLAHLVETVAAWSAARLTAAEKGRDGICGLRRRRA